MSDIERVRTAILRTIEAEDAHVSAVLISMLQILAWLAVEHGWELAIVRDLIETIEERAEEEERAGAMVQ